MKINEIIFVHWLKVFILLSFYLTLFILPYFPYILDVNKVVHKMSILMIPTSNEFLCVGKELLTGELHVFLSSEASLIWNLALLIRWEKPLFFNSLLLKSKLIRTFFVFLVYVSINFIAFFLTDSSSFSSSDIWNLLFLVYEKSI